LTAEYLILVDKNDNPVGTEEKIKCHLQNGKLHRAFTVLLFNEEGKLLLTKRSESKMLWPGDWDGTVASHPREAETYIASAERRIPEEVGISCKLEYLFKFEYHVSYKDIGSENEICGTLIGIIKNSSSVNLVEEEISEVRWITCSELMDELQKTPNIFCPWMVIPLYFMLDSQIMEKKIDTIFDPWLNPENKHLLEKPLKFHFPDNNWRLVA